LKILITYLLRAIRGGGPGTWGVVTSITYKTYPAVPVAWVSITNKASSIEENYELVQKFVKKAPDWADLGGGSFINIFPTFISYLGMVPNVTTEELKKGLPDLPAGSKATYTEAPSFLSFFNESFAISNEV
jgi:FAD/FMN-containing dehydrogenase